MVITEEFQRVVVADTICCIAIGKRIAASKKPMIRSTTTISLIPALFPARTFCAACVLISAVIGTSKNDTILASIVGLTLDVMPVVAKVLSR